MKLKIIDIAFHRNGICGAPFHAIIFRDPDVGQMLGVVFDEPHHVAVFNMEKLAIGNITFGCQLVAWRPVRNDSAKSYRIFQQPRRLTMPRTYPLEIALDEFSDERIDAVIGEIEEAVENIRKYHGGDANTSRTWTSTNYSLYTARLPSSGRQTTSARWSLTWMTTKP